MKNPKGLTTIAVCETYGKNDQKIINNPKGLTNGTIKNNVNLHPNILSHCVCNKT